MTKSAPKTTQPKKRLSDAERAKRKQTVVFVAISIIVVLSMLVSLIRFV
ncbi:MAG TPA: hypothetical protein VFF78_01110 [Anaerolineaceae bacterium]|nr:hypothetical protein [Anaerolineaceae bacterium]